jgi:hypothetical protein
MKKNSKYKDYFMEDIMQMVKMYEPGIGFYYVSKDVLETTASGKQELPEYDHDGVVHTSLPFALYLP